MANLKDIINYLGLVMQLGLCIAISVFIASLVGVFLDRKLNTGIIFTIIFIIFGIVGGIKGAYSLIMQLEKKDEKLRGKNSS